MWLYSVTRPLPGTTLNPVPSSATDRGMPGALVVIVRLVRILPKVLGFPSCSSLHAKSTPEGLATGVLVVKPGGPSSPFEAAPPVLHHRRGSQPRAGPL